MQNEIRVFLVDDHGLVLDAVSERLQRELDFTVVGRATRADEAIPLIDRTCPDIVLMDINMPGLLSFEAARQISESHPDTRIIFLSAFVQDTYIEQALAAKAHGYVAKREPVDRVIKAIREVASGGAYFSEEVSSRIVVDTSGARLRDPAVSRLSLLSRRELEMLCYVAKGLGKKEMAQITGRAVKTIDHHITRMMSKLDIHDRVALTRFAIREGLAESE